MAENTYIVVMTTVNSSEEAERIGRLIVKERAAACVTISSPVQSIYWWQEKITSDREWMLFIKTRSTNYPLVERIITENHSYTVPEILALPVQEGANPYLNWIGENTQKPTD